MKSALALFDKYRNVVVVLTKSKATIFLNSLVTSNSNQCLLHYGPIHGFSWKLDIFCIYIVENLVNGFIQQLQWLLETLYLLSVRGMVLYAFWIIVAWIRSWCKTNILFLSFCSCPNGSSFTIFTKIDLHDTYNLTQIYSDLLETLSSFCLRGMVLYV